MMEVEFINASTQAAGGVVSGLLVLRPEKDVTVQASSVSLHWRTEGRGDVNSSEVSKVDLKNAPRHLSNKAGGLLATHTDASGHERPLHAVYQARVTLRGAARQHAVRVVGPNARQMPRDREHFESVRL